MLGDQRLSRQRSHMPKRQLKPINGPWDGQTNNQINVMLRTTVKQVDSFLLRKVRRVLTAEAADETQTTTKRARFDVIKRLLLFRLQTSLFRLQVSLFSCIGDRLGPNILHDKSAVQ